MKRTDFSPLTWLAGVIRAPELHGQDKARLVAAAILKYARANGGNAHPGRALLAEDLDISVNTVDRALRRLVDAGWLVRVQSGSTAPRRNYADVYQLTVPIAPPEPAPSRSREILPVVIGSGQPAVHDQSPNWWDHSPNDADQSPKPWVPNCLSPSVPIHLSDSDESGPPVRADNLTSGDEDPGLDVDEPLEWVANQVIGFEGYEESTARGMLIGGSNRIAVRNKLLAQREGR